MMPGRNPWYLIHMARFVTFLIIGLQPNKTLVSVWWPARTAGAALESAVEASFELVFLFTFLTKKKVNRGYRAERP